MFFKKQYPEIDFDAIYVLNLKGNTPMCGYQETSVVIRFLDHEKVVLDEYNEPFEPHKKSIEDILLIPISELIDFAYNYKKSSDQIQIKYFTYAKEDRFFDERDYVEYSGTIYSDGLILTLHNSFYNESIEDYKRNCLLENLKFKKYK